MIAGKQSQVVTLDFENGMGGDVFRAAFKEVLNHYPEESLLIICDLVGGTPFKAAVELTLDRQRVEVVAGCSLGAIIETILQRDKADLKDLGDKAIESTKASCMRFEKSESSIPNPLPSEDGI